MKGYVSRQKYEELQAKYAAAEFRKQQLERLIFGAKSERFYSDLPPTEQLDLFGANAEQAEQNAAPVLQKIAEHTRRVPAKKKPARLVLPEHLPRKETVVLPENLTEEMIKIGEERSEQLAYKPAELHVEVTVRPKYALPAAQQQEENHTPVLIAEMPVRFIPKCIAHHTLLSAVLVDKYVDHLPLYRTIDRIFRLSEVRLPKSTLSGWVKQSAEALDVLYKKLIEIILAADYLQVDETRMEVLPNSPPPSDKEKRKRSRKRKTKPIKRKTERGWLWVYHAPRTKLTFFDYDPSRGANNPARHLKNYSGTAQSDGLEVYELLAKAFPDMEHYQCLVHARRKFEAALGNDRARAEHALQVFQQIYALEQRGREQKMSADELQEEREKYSRPLLQGLFEWMKAERKKVLPKEPIGQAMHYMLKREQGLLHYLTDGRLLPDTNLVENAIRPVAVGRKNYLFAGSHDAAQWSAVFYSFFACCKANNVDPYTWLVDVMNRLPTQSILELEELLPHKWVKEEEEEEEV